MSFEPHVSTPDNDCKGIEKATDMENEKRKAKRITYMCEVECVGAEVPSLRTRITDLSTAGVFIDSLTCFAVA